ncbi:flippase-like domain-containing protein [Rhizobium sp. TH2]|uniref:flippase-like domain-containing protein n=1 Tax=Rhizobium sp. TH2 TaxID=2775403 RepID=UPI00215807B8|nr:flippase-like domain-containing protein [Rhizobium sp. TH2]UVC09052.1 flippase-like domain-containing protein [Rhizobium sp. TH2]
MTARDWLLRNRITLLTIAVVALYAIFIEWFFGWSTILAGWQAVGIWTILLALTLLVGTYFIRTHRMQDYFPRETSGQFLKLFRVTQVHNLLNIMLPFRTGETSFPLLMRSEFGVPLAHGTSALLVLRLLDLHALLAAAGLGLIASASRTYLVAAFWAVFLLLPLILFPLKSRLIVAMRQRLPERLATLVDEIDDGLPRNVSAFTRAWMLTVLNWGVKVLVLAWVLGLMGVLPVAATFGGALGGELSSVLPVHAPAGVGTYPAGIGAGAAAFGSARDAATLELLAKASINTHLLMIVSALLGTGLSLILPSMFVRKSPSP